MQCLDEDVLASLLDGSLEADRVQQVVEHIGGCEACREWLVASFKVERGEADRGESNSSTLAPGTLVGRYVVLEALGAGGMGVVYLAFDPKLDRKVALKLLRADLVAQEEGPTRLLREAQALARLAHPHVIAVHDVGTYEGQVFMAMEFAEGGTLTRWLREKPRSWREIVGAFLQAGAGLAAAHASGLLHRDFKPDNVLVSRDGRFRVTDFGLARPAEQLAPIEPPRALAHPEIVEERTALETPLTVEGTLLGTPAYMSPEQHLRDRVEARSDQFSFCAALFEALFGQRPFSGASATELAEQKLSGRIRPPPEGSRVPQWIRRAVLSGLSAKPGDRFGSMDELLRELARDPGAARRRWILRATPIALIAMAVLGWRGIVARQQTMCRGAEQKLAGLWDGARKQQMREAFRATAEPTAAEAWERTEKVVDLWASGWTTMHTEACEATRLRGDQSDEVLSLRMACLQRRLDELKALAALFARPDAKIVEKSVLAAHSLGSLAQCADAEALRASLPPPSDERTRAAVAAVRVQLTEARILLASGKYRDALERASAAELASRAVDYPPLRAEALESMGWLQEKNGDIAGAEKNLREAAWLAESQRHDLVVVRAATELTYVTGVDRREGGPARQWSELAESVIARLGGNDEQTVRLLTYRGTAQRTQGAKEEAEANLRRALELAVKALGPTHPWVAQAHDRLGGVLLDMGRAGEALAEHQRALEINEASLGRTHPHVATTLVNLGKALLVQGRAREAIAVLERALQIRIASVPNAAALASTRFALARALVESNAERARAAQLASDAAVGFAEAQHAHERDEVLSWLAQHQESE